MSKRKSNRLQRCIPDVYFYPLFFKLFFSHVKQNAVEDVMIVMMMFIQRTIADGMYHSNQRNLLRRQVQ